MSLFRRTSSTGKVPEDPAGRTVVSESAPGLEDGIEAMPKQVRVGSQFSQTLVCVGYPKEVSAGWLGPLLSYQGDIDVSLHIAPVPNQLAVQRLRKKLARFESSRNLDASGGRLPDEDTEAAAEDAGLLLRDLARQQKRLFTVGIYVTVRAASDEGLQAEVKRVRSVCSSLLIRTVTPWFRSAEAWVSSRPYCLDLLKAHRTFDTASLANCFPFGSGEIESRGSILYGRNSVTGGLIFCDRFAHDNHNQVILARSGAGKSYFTKLQILRSLYEGVQVFVIDPENEYERLAGAVGGTVVSAEDPESWRRLSSDGEGDGSHLIVFCVRGASEKNQTDLIIRGLDYVWDTATGGRPRKRLVFVDEAWALLGSGRQDTAERLHRLAKSGRKNFFGLTTITQDVHDILTDELGHSIINNAESHVLFRQSPHAVEPLAETFGLSEAEVSYLISCSRGQGLLSIGSERAAFRVVASPRENETSTSDPAELLRIGGAR